MNFREAAKTIIDFGKYNGKTIEEISLTDKGLKYLDWAYGNCVVHNPVVQRAIEIYMEDNIIKKELAEVLDGDYD